MKSKLVQIFFFEDTGSSITSGKVQTTEVLHADLPVLSGARTYWRESIPDALRGVRLKEKLRLKFENAAKTA